ncbi:hypothetical protein [Streptomyces sp. NPDC049040]|uniref:hypothetical protein n=1 Tax=Streptomyces sp. NPDC049040 TaxID=3365593 RepID=UPI003711D0B9
MSASRIMVGACAAIAATAALTGCVGADGEGDSSAPLLAPAVVNSAAVKTPAASGKDVPYSYMTAEGLLATAQANMRDSGAMTISMNAVEEGQKLQVKAALTAKGTCAAALRIGGRNIQIITTDARHAYMKADDAFWRQTGGSRGDKVVDAIDGRWVKLTQEMASNGGVREFCSLTEMLDGLLLTDDDSDTEVVKGEPTTLDGKQVIPLIEKLPDETDTMYVSTGSTPYIVKIEGEGGDSPGSGTFGDFGKDPHVVAPPPSQTVDMADLGIEPGDGDFAV